MIKKFLPLLLVSLLLVIPLWGQAQQPATVEIASVNDSDFPQMELFVTVTGADGIPILDLGEADFEALLGSESLEIISVENITVDELPIAVVLVMDSSESMVGKPLDDSKAAAITFLDNLREGDEVAVIDFDTEVRVAQPFTTDLAAVADVISNLEAGGRTALYDAAFESANLALTTDNPRRFVVFLTDGNEFGGVSRNPAEAGVTLSDENNIPIYTVGLGFNIDQRYLVDLASASGGELFVSPSSEQLNDIYDRLSRFLRTQYIVTVRTNAEPDGSTYDLTANSQGGSATTAYAVPDLYPQIAFSNVPETPISEVTEVGVRIDAPRKLEGAGTNVDGERYGETINEIDFEAGVLDVTVTLNPYDFSPGVHTINATANDQAGGIREASANFEVATLPTVFSISGIGEVVSEENLIVDVTLDQVQTPPDSVQFLVDGNEFALLTEAPYQAGTNVLELGEGEHTVTINVNESDGTVTSQSVTFTPDPILFFEPTEVTVTGLANNDFVNEALVDIAVDVTGTPEIASVDLGIDGEAVQSLTSTPYEFTLDVLQIGPGPHTLVVSAVDTEGNSTTQSIDFTVSADLFFEPTEVTINGISEGDVVDTESVSISVDVTGTPTIESVVINADGAEIANLTEAPYEADVDILSLGEGEHTLDVIVTDTEGVETSESVTFGTDPDLFFQPLTFEIEGLEDNEFVETETVDVSIVTSGTPEVASVVLGIDGEVIATLTEAPYETQINMLDLGGGPHSLVVAVTDTEGNEITETLDFTVSSALFAEPTTVTINGLADGESIDTPEVDISVDVGGTAEVDSVSIIVDGEEVASLTDAPYEQTLDIIELGEGDHTLEVEVTTADGVTSSGVVSFTADSSLFSTPEPTEEVALPVITETPIPSETPVPSNTPTDVPTDTPQPTETNTPIPTDTATDTAVPSETPTDVPTDVPTETDTPTDEPTATDTPTDEPTEPPTETLEPTITATATTPPEPTAVQVEDGEGDSAGINPLLVICGVILLLLLLIWYFWNRRQTDEQRRP